MVSEAIIPLRPSKIGLQIGDVIILEKIERLWLKKCIFSIEIRKKDKI